jgi:LysR family cyn operon transcriptional activator
METIDGISGMELRHLRYFQALAATLNFTRAAEKSHVTQSTLSHQIRQLEDELGVELFERVGKKVLLTEAGENLLDQVTPAMRMIDEAAWHIRDTTDEVKGTIRVGATHSFNIRLVPDCIAAFLNRHPSIKVVVEELSGNEITERLRQNQIDLGISYRPEDQTDLHFEPLYNEELKLVVGKNHPLAKRKKIRMVELQMVRMTLLPQYFSTRKILDECFAAARVEPLVVVELNSVMPMVELVKKTDLASIVSEMVVADRRDLRVIPIEDPTPMRTPGLLWARGGAQPEAVRHFINAVRRYSAKG